MRTSLLMAVVLMLGSLALPAVSQADVFCPPDQQMPCDQGTRSDGDDTETGSRDHAAR
jgi:hypothetical protein